MASSASQLAGGTLFFGALAALVKFGGLVFLFVMPLASLLTWMERRQSAYSQDRLGPTRAYFFKIKGKPFTAAGLLHIAADGLKLFFKEPFRPRLADPWVFNAAPAMGLVTSLTVMALVPFGPDIFTGWGGRWDRIPLQVARLDTGLLWILALSSLGMYGAALAGWASNNRFALLGGLRAAAQSISYELALGLTAVGALVVFGTTELASVVFKQGEMAWGGWVPMWGIFLQPVGAVLFLVAAMAETKRVPFDLPEGESEIIGYFVEYSSMGFGLFMLGEFVEVVVLSAVFTTLFLGGWQLPYLLGDHVLRLGFATLSLSPWVYAGIGMLVFGLKVFIVCALQLQLRWSLPRFRYDQLMQLGWKGLVPLAILNILVTTLLVGWDPSLKLLTGVGFGILGGVGLAVVAGPRRQLSILPTSEHVGM